MTELLAELDGKLASFQRQNDILAQELARQSQGVCSSQLVTYAPHDGDRPWSAPTRSHEHDAGADIRTCVDFTLAPNGTGSVPTNTTVDIPKGYVGILAVRSGVGAQGVTLLNGIGVIDHGYEGEIKILLANLGTEEFSAKAGDRIAQMIVQPCVTGGLSMCVLAAPQRRRSERGEGGLGSTGA